MNHGPARRQGRSRRHRRCVPEPRLSAAPVQGDQGFAVDPRTCKLLPQASKCTQGFAQPQQPTPGHPGSHQHGHRARDPTRDSVLAAGDGVCAGRPTLQGTRAPQGVTASPVAWVPAPAPPRPSAGWEPQTEIPPVAARPAPVTRGTRRSGYTSRTRRQTRHSSAGTGAPAPTTVPRAGTAVPRCHRHCPGPAGAGSLDLEGAGSATNAQRCPGQPRTAGQPRSTVGTTPRHCPPMEGGPARPPPRSGTSPVCCFGVGSWSRGALSQFPRTPGKQHGSRSRQPLVVFSPGCGAQPAPWERRAGNSAAPDSPFWLGDSRQTSAAGCAAGRGTGPLGTRRPRLAWVDPAGRRPRDTSGHRDLVAPCPRLGQAPGGRDQARLGSAVPGGAKPPLAAGAAGGRADARQCHVPPATASQLWHSRERQRPRRAHAAPRRALPRATPR